MSNATGKLADRQEFLRLPELIFKRLLLWVKRHMLRLPVACPDMNRAI